MEHSLNDKPPPPEPFFIGIVGALFAFACLMVFETLTPGNPDPKGYAFMATGAVFGVGSWAFAYRRRLAWFRQQDTPAEVELEKPSPEEVRRTEAAERKKLAVLEQGLRASARRGDERAKEIADDISRALHGVQTHEDLAIAGTGDRARLALLVRILSVREDRNTPRDQAKLAAARRLLQSAD